MVEKTICLQCGNRGFENAFVYCIRCLKFAVHRYCLDEIPETFDEFVCWLCDDCKVKVQKQSAVFEHDAIPCQTIHHKVSKTIQSFSTNGTEKNVFVIVENEHVFKDASKSDLVECGELASKDNPVELDGENVENTILLPVDVSEISQLSLSLHQLEEEKVEGNLIGSIVLSAGYLTESTTEKDQCRLATTYAESVKVDIDECTRSTSGSTLPCIVKETRCSEQKDQEKKKIKNKKERERQKQRNIMESTTEKDEHRLATASYNEHVKVDIKECKRSGSDSTLPSKVKENGCSEEKDQEEKKIENKKRKRKRNIKGSTTEKDERRLATTSYDECMKLGIKECTRLESDLTLSSKVKENGCSEQKDQEKKKIMNKKVKKRQRQRKRTKNIMGSTTEKDNHRLATASYNEHVKVDIKECKRSGSDSTLPSKVKENGCSEEKDQEEKKIENKKRKRKRNIKRSTTEKDEHRLATTSYDECMKVGIKECTRLESDLTLSSKENGCSEQKDQGKKKIKNKKAKKRQRQRKRTKNIIGSTTEKEQHRLAITSYDEHVKVDINECTRLGSDSTLPSNEKENEGFEQKDQMCITKLDSITDLGVTGADADHPVISSDGPSKSSGKKKTIMFETISQKQVDQTGVAQPLHANKRLCLENELVDFSCQEKDLGSSNDRIKNRGTVDKEEQISTSYLKGLAYSVAQPIATPIWRGSFSIRNSKYDNIDELIAHISNKACHKVYKAASQFQPVLHLEMLSKSDIWPKRFQTSEPNGDNIALYFFPSEIRSYQAFEQLVEEMIHKELAFKGIVQSAELLIFTSTELPLRYWRFQNKYYLWGVFRGKQAAPSNPLSCAGEVAETPSIRKRCDVRSPIGPLSNSATSGLGTW